MNKDIYASDEPIELDAIRFTNERGNVCVGERNRLHKAMVEFLTSNFEDQYVEDNVNGGISVMQGIDSTTGDTIWAHITVKINTKAPNIDNYTGKPKIKSAAPAIPNLFE